MTILKSEYVDSFELDSVPAGTSVCVRWIYSRFPDGSPAALPVCVIVGNQPGKTAVLVAGVHGDEYEGVHALWQLMRSLKPDMLAGRVVIIPVANGAAYNAGQRTSPVDGVNLARIFPGDPNGTLTYRLAHHLFHNIVRHADVLVDCHSGGVRMEFLPVAGFYTAGGEITDASSALSRLTATAMHLPWLWALPHRAGVMSYEAAKLGIPVTGCEIGGRGGRLENDTTLYKSGIISVLRQWGLMEQELPMGGRPRTLTGDWTAAPASGLIVHHVELGAQVNAGDRIASVLDAFGNEHFLLTAQHDGIVAGLRYLPSIQTGELAYWIAKES